MALELDKGLHEYELSELQQVVVSMQDAIENMKATKTAYLQRAKDAEQAVHENQLRIAKMKEDSAIEARAREGQVKRLRIMDHKLQQVMLDNERKAEERDRVVSQLQVLQTQLNRERAQRLHDMHNAFRVAGSNAAAARDIEAMQKTFYAQQHELERVNERCAALNAAFNAQESATRRALADNMDAHAEMERAEANILMLKTTLLAAEENHDRLQRIVDSQRREIQRLSTELIRKAKTLPASRRLLSSVATSHDIANQAIKRNGSQFPDLGAIRHAIMASKCATSNGPGV